MGSDTGRSWFLRRKQEMLSIDSIEPLLKYLENEMDIKDEDGD